MATHTHPEQWYDTDPRIVATVMHVLEERAKAMKKGRR